MKETFYVTTPIYYTNGVPHIGHSYSSLLADTLARYKKTSGHEVKFCTWVDENSQKALEVANEKWMEIMEYLDDMAYKHKAVWDGLNLEYTDFIRTTEDRHHEFVREVLQKSFDNGDIYEGEYEGYYCVGCEAFIKEDELIEKEWEKVCKDHLKAPDLIKEKNYFFKLSKYQDYLETFYKENPEFVQPQERFNEVIEFVKRWLEDFSISRETNKFGIKLPFDESQVTYVWYDALFNYLTVCQNDKDENGKEKFWPADLHIVGKDIIKFHAIYWPAMLKSAGYEMPKNILATGFFTIDWHKISKSLGNVIDPVEFSEKYSKDLMTLYLFSAINIWFDGDFDTKQAIALYNAKMANNLWNLLNRVLVLKLKLTDSPLTWALDTDISNAILEYNETFKKAMDSYNLKEALDSSFFFLDKINKYVDETAPWKMLKDESLNAETANVLYTMAEALRNVWVNLYAFFPEKMTEMLERLGCEDYGDDLINGLANELLSRKEEFNITEKGQPLYSRFEIEE